MVVSTYNSAIPQCPLIAQTFQSNFPHIEFKKGSKIKKDVK